MQTKRSGTTAVTAFVEASERKKRKEKGAKCWRGHCTVQRVEWVEVAQPEPDLGWVGEQVDEWVGG